MAKQIAEITRIKRDFLNGHKGGWRDHFDVHFGSLKLHAYYQSIRLGSLPPVSKVIDVDQQVTAQVLKISTITPSYNQG